MNQEVYRIYDDAYHYLDFGAHPNFVGDLFEEQLNDPEVEKVAMFLGKHSNPTDGIPSRLRKIQQFIHDQTFHMRQRDRIELFGYLNFEETGYNTEFILNVFNTIQELCRYKPREAIDDTWENDRINKRCVGSKASSFQKSLNYIHGENNLPILQCAEEATLAATLAVKLAGIPLDRIVFLSSPAHVMCFIRPVEGKMKKGCIFNSKMLYFSRDMGMFGNIKEERLNNFLALFGNLWAVTSSCGSFDVSLINSNLLEGENRNIWQELTNLINS